MSLRKSALLAVRGLVLLSCLVVVPAIAVFGTLSPTGMLSVVETRWTAHMASGEEVADSRVSAVGQKSPDVGPLGGSQAAVDPCGTRGLAKTDDLRRSAHCDSPLPAGWDARSAQGSALGGAESARGNSQLQRFQQRLRQLGATYCRLETWGEQGELYRFHCRVAMGNSSGFSRHFEATDADPLQAVAKVVSEVESSVARR